MSNNFACLHIDPARRQLSFDTILDIGRNWKLCGGNTIHLHLTDDQGIACQLEEGIQIPVDPPPLTIEEQIELGRYFQEIDLDVVVEVGMPGHSTALISYLKYRDDPYTVVYTPDKTYASEKDKKNKPVIDLKDLDTILQLCDGLVKRFQAQYFHMGGDEWAGLGPGGNLKKQDSIDNPSPRSWNYARQLTNRICKWAEERGLEVIAWEEHFKHLWGYQEMYNENNVLIPNVNKDLLDRKLILDDGTITKVTEKNVKGSVIASSWNFQQISEKVYKIPDNLLMQRWIQTPTFQWQRYIMPQNRVIRSDGFYLDTMAKSPIQMAQTYIDPKFYGHTACVWGEWIGEQNIRNVLNYVTILLGARFSGDAETLDVVLLEKSRSNPRLLFEGVTHEKEWRTRTWRGFSKDDQSHPLSTVNDPARETDMSTIEEVMYPSLSKFLVDYFIHVYKYSIPNGHPENFINYVLIRNATNNIKEAALTGKEAEAEQIMFALMQGKNISSNLNKLNKKTLMEEESYLFGNGFWMINKRLKNFFSSKRRSDEDLDKKQHKRRRNDAAARFLAQVNGDTEAAARLLAKHMDLFY